MKKLAIIELFLLGVILIGIGILFKPIMNKYMEYREMYRDISGDNYAEEEKMNIIINNKTYQTTLEDNQTTKEFLNLLPLDITMNDLNSNEKYYNLDKKLTTNSINYKKVNKGDVMLYNNNCIVIFYKSFDTNYNYTKIAHIDNLDDLDNNSINVRFERG